MIDVLQALSLILVALAMVPVLAHALELPGKLRLRKDAYFAIQPVYYPGFTIAGTSEPAAIIATTALLAVTPRGDADFWLTAVAVVALVCMHAVYWVFTHPVNDFWLKDEKLGRLGSGFFSFGSGRRNDTGPADWTTLRDRWEYSHVARAGLAFLGFVTLAIAVSSVSEA